MSVSCGDNPASEALRQLYSALVRTVQDPELLACDLYCKGVVSESATDEMTVLGIPATIKRMKLLSLVRDQIAVDPDKLDMFVQALKEREPTVGIAEELSRM